MALAWHGRRRREDRQLGLVLGVDGDVVEDAFVKNDEGGAQGSQQKQLKKLHGGLFEATCAPGSRSMTEEGGETG